MNIKLKISLLKIKYKNQKTSFLIIGFLFLTNCFLSSPLQKTTKILDIQIDSKHFSTWEQVFAINSSISITAIKNGEVLTGPSVLIDEDDPNTPESEKKEQWVPALTYVVKHPKVGVFLMDSGVRKADANGRCDFSLYGPIYNIECKAEPNMDTASQLPMLGISFEDIQFVLISHLHGDHVGGIKNLLEKGKVQILVSEEEAKAASQLFRMFHGYSPVTLKQNFDVKTISKKNEQLMPIFGKVINLFGDGSVWIIPTPGHTKGEIAVLIHTQSDDFLFTFDSSHLKSGFENNIIPGFTVNRNEAKDSLNRMREFKKKYPKLKVIYGHEPSQWIGKNIYPLTAN